MAVNYGFEDVDFPSLIDRNRELNTRDGDRDIQFNYFFYKKLEAASPTLIKQILENSDNIVELPFHMVSDLHQRLILLEESSENILSFTAYLRSMGNSWHYLAEYLDKIAYRLQSNQ
jgi:hypothetical protein